MIPSFVSFRLGCLHFFKSRSAILEHLRFWVSRSSWSFCSTPWVGAIGGACVAVSLRTHLLLFVNCLVLRGLREGRFWSSCPINVVRSIYRGEDEWLLSLEGKPWRAFYCMLFRHWCDWWLLFDLFRCFKSVPLLQKPSLYWCYRAIITPINSRGAWKSSRDSNSYPDWKSTMTIIRRYDGKHPSSTARPKTLRFVMLEGDAGIQASYYYSNHSPSTR